MLVENPRAPVARNVALILTNSVFAAAFFWISGVAMSVPPFLSLYVSRLSGSDFVRSLVPVLWCAPALISLAASYLSERLKRNQLLCVCSLVAMSVIAALAGAAPLLVGSPGTLPMVALMGGILIANVLSNLYFFSLFAWFPDLLDERYIGKLTAARLLMFWAVGAIVNPLAGEWLHTHEGTGGFPVLYAISGGMGVLAAVPLLFARGVRREQAPHEPFLAGARQIWEDRNFRMLLGLVLMMSMAPMLSGAYSAIFLSETLQFSDRQFGLINMLPSVAALLTVLGWGRLADGLGARIVMLGGIVGYIGSPALMALSTPGHALPTFPAYVIGGALGSAYSVAWVPLMFALSPRHKRATAMGFVWVATATGGLVVPFLGGAIVNALKGFSFAVGARSFGPVNVLLALQAVVAVCAIPFYLALRLPQHASARQAFALFAQRPLMALWQGMLGDQLLALIRRSRGKSEPQEQDRSSNGQPRLH